MHGHPGATGAAAPAIDVDIREKSRVEKDGKPQILDRRLFMQLLVFTGCKDYKNLTAALKKAKFPSVLYSDMHDPQGIGLLTMHENPEFFVTTLRDFLNKSGFSKLRLRRSMSMLGKTYSLGFEKNLEDWLIHRSPRVVCNPEWQWAVWYPLRRKGSFALLPKEEQNEILKEHGTIGHAFGSADLGHDIRLNCNGIDQTDNDFVIGLIGKDLHPLSALVQTMRKTKQTSTHIEKMGPFFTGKAVFQSAVKKP
ncbi:MAG: chlorite dismutase family protein [Deltaproteobacteria bacterium]|nr:chlorite dismutase family protein [Deltaproteobacteria bacterium]